MNILYLGPYHEKMIKFLTGFGDSIVIFEEALSWHDDMLKEIDFIISYGFRNIVPPDIVKSYLNKAINLHISLLPWNRGADPNLWSFLKDTPKGVTIHYLDVNLDSGAILAQKEVSFDEKDTLCSSYEKLKVEVEILFMESWPKIRFGDCCSFLPQGRGSYHRSIDKNKFLHLLTNGWDTLVEDIRGKGLIKGENYNES